MLKSIPVFRALTSRELLEVDELLHERVYEKGEVVFERGDTGHGVFIVLRGRMRVNSSSRLLEHAGAEFGAGDMLGELCLFDEASRAVTVTAMERTVAVALFHAELSSLLTQNKRIGVKLLIEIARTMSQRMRRLLLHEAGVPCV
jgi:CRP-like cAMP-binding protein